MLYKEHILSPTITNKVDKITRFLKFVPDTGSRKDCLYVSRTKQSLTTALQLYYEQENFGFSASTLKGRRDLRLKIETYLKETNRPDIVLANVDVDFCRGFIDFLRYAKNGVRKDGSVISNGAAHHHQAVLNGALNKAVRDGILSANPLKSISSKEKYQPSESMREYLTLEEMKAVMAASCPHEDVKRAFLFSCFTGLRLGDVRSLTWGKIVKAPDGKTLFVRTKMEKTQKIVNVPLSKKAIDCLNPKENNDEPIFTLPTGTSNIERNIEKWMQAAKITKHITYHAGRHTFATMMLTLGADLYTVCKLLGHTDVKTTQIYAKITTEKIDKDLTTFGNRLNQSFNEISIAM